MLMIFMNKIKEELKRIISYFNSSYISTRFLIVICLLCFTIIIVSIFIPIDNTNSNFDTIRFVFSSIMGYLLENVSHKISCKDESLHFRNFFLGFISLLIVLILLISLLLNVNLMNPSITLIINVLLSCIVFLIASSRKCN